MKRVVATLLLTWSASIHAGPLGLEFGTPLASLKHLKLTDGGGYRYATHSQWHGDPNIATVLLRVTPQHGLCSYTAIFKEVRNDADGTRLKRQFAATKASMDKQYGTSTTFDFVKPDSTYKKPTEFLLSISKGERGFGTEWSSQTHRLPNGVSKITMIVTADDASTGGLTIYYDSPRTAECKNLSDAQRALSR